MLITTKLAAFGSIDFPTIFAKRSWQFWAQELEKTAMISWQKLSGKSIEPNTASFVDISIGL